LQQLKRFPFENHAAKVKHNRHELLSKN